MAKEDRNVIEVRGLNHWFGTGDARKQALYDLDLTIEAGSFTVLMGPSGSGKTTVLNHLLRHPGAERVAVLINELGDVGVDHHLVEQVDETLVVLDGGCVCCIHEPVLHRNHRRRCRERGSGRTHR